MVNRKTYFGLLALTASVAFTSGCSVYRQTVPGYCVGSGYYESRSDKEPINFIRLRQAPPEAYRLDERDVFVDRRTHGSVHCADHHGSLQGRGREHAQHRSSDVPPPLLVRFDEVHHV